MKGYHKSTEPHRESGKIYCDANNILLKHPPPPLDKEWSHPFFNLSVVDVVSFFSVFLIKLKKGTWWEFTKLCLCCSKLMSMFTHNWGRKMQIGCNDFSVGMLSVFLFVCFLDLCLFVENFLFAHWNKVQAVALTFPKVWVNMSITVCIN